MLNSTSNTSSDNASGDDLQALVDSILGTDGNDVLSDTAGDDNIDALAGDDVIIATTGNDVIDGGDGFDVIDYSNLGQAVTLLPNGQIDNGSQSSSTNVEGFIGASGQANAVNGDTGVNNGVSFNVDLASNNLTINNIPGIGNLEFTVENFTDVVGTTSNDRLVGNESANSLAGNTGDDFIEAGGGDDILDGDLGNDFLNASAGNDSLLGGDGDDFLAGGDGNDTLNGGNGNDNLAGGSGEDLFVVSSGEGTGSIADFELGQDTIGLSGGLSFEDLSFSGNRITSGDESLVAVEGLDPSTLSADNFTTV